MIISFCFRSGDKSYRRVAPSSRTFHSACRSPFWHFLIIAFSFTVFPAFPAYLIARKNHIQVGSNIKKVPPTDSARPNAAFLESLSLNTIAEKAIDTKMLNLSIGTTTLAGPSFNAL